MFPERQPIIDEICARLAEGEPLAKICRDVHMPSDWTVREWCKSNESFSSAIACARDVGFDVIAAESLQIVDTTPERTNTEHGSKVDAGHVAWLKARADHRLKLLAKWDPKRYGDKQQVEHSGTINTADAILAARGRGG